MTARPLRFFEGQALNYSRVWRASIFTNCLNRLSHHLVTSPLPTPGHEKEEFFIAAYL